MSVFGRLWFAFGGLTAIATVGVVYARVGKPLIDIATGDGPFTGFMSDLVTRVDTFFPVLLAMLTLAVAVYVLIGGITRERSVNRRRPPQK